MDMWRLLDTVGKQEGARQIHVVWLVPSMHQLSIYLCCLLGQVPKHINSLKFCSVLHAKLSDHTTLQLQLNAY